MEKVTIYITETCAYCTRAKNLLKQKGVTQFEEIRVDKDPSQRDKMIELTKRRTVPQIFIGSFHVGGFDDLSELNQAGKLDELLK